MRDLGPINGNLVMKATSTKKRPGGGGGGGGGRDKRLHIEFNQWYIYSYHRRWLDLDVIKI